VIIEVWLSGLEPTKIRRSALVRQLSVRKDPQVDDDIALGPHKVFPLKGLLLVDSKNYVSAMLFVKKQEQGLGSSL